MVTSVESFPVNAVPSPTYDNTEVSISRSHSRQSPLSPPPPPPPLSPVTSLQTLVARSVSLRTSPRDFSPPSLSGHVCLSYAPASGGANRFLLFGGVRAPGTILETDVYEYSLAPQGWRRLETKGGCQCYGGAASLCRGEIFFTGGITVDTPGIIPLPSQNIPSTGERVVKAANGFSQSFSRTPSGTLPLSRWSHTVGFSSSGAFFSLKTLKWRPGPGVPRIFASACELSSGDGVLIFGGLGSDLNPTSDAFIINPQTGVRQLPALERASPPPRYLHSCVASNGVVFIVGGIGSGATPLDDVWVFASEVWQQVESLPGGPRFSPCTWITNNYLAVWGGCNASRTTFSSLLLGSFTQQGTFLWTTEQSVNGPASDITIDASNLVCAPCGDGETVFVHSNTHTFLLRPGSPQRERHRRSSSSATSLVDNARSGKGDHNETKDRRLTAFLRRQSDFIKRCDLDLSQKQHSIDLEVREWAEPRIYLSEQEIEKVIDSAVDTVVHFDSLDHFSLPPTIPRRHELVSALEAIKKCLYQVREVASSMRVSSPPSRQSKHHVRRTGEKFEDFSAAKPFRRSLISNLISDARYQLETVSNIKKELKTYSWEEKGEFFELCTSLRDAVRRFSAVTGHLMKCRVKDALKSMADADSRRQRNIQALREQVERQENAWRDPEHGGSRDMRARACFGFTVTRRRGDAAGERCTYIGYIERATIRDWLRLGERVKECAKSLVDDEQLIRAANAAEAAVIDLQRALEESDSVLRESVIKREKLTAVMSVSYTRYTQYRKNIIAALGLLPPRAMCPPAARKLIGACKRHLRLIRLSFLASRSEKSLIQSRSKLKTQTIMKKMHRPLPLPNLSSICTKSTEGLKSVDISNNKNENKSSNKSILSTVEEASISHKKLDTYRDDLAERINVEDMLYSTGENNPPPPLVEPPIEDDHVASSPNMSHSSSSSLTKSSSYTEYEDSFTSGSESSSQRH